MKITLILCVVCISLYGAYGMPEPSQLDTESSNQTDTNQNRQKRQLSDGVDIGLRWLTQAVSNSNRCAEKAGCHKGYCWTYCGLSLSGGDWCYTTRAHSQSFQYIKCSSDSECSPCWKCAGSCTL